jgi:hypothetical protein
MKLNRKSGANLATTAAVLVVTGAVLIGSATATEIKGRCFGVNACKGQGECKSSASWTEKSKYENKCKGQNGCKGQGWVSMLQADCQGTWEPAS